MPVFVLFWGAMLMMLLKEIGQMCYHVLDFDNVAVGTQATAAILLFYIMAGLDIGACPIARGK